MSLLTIGSAAYDSIETPFGKRDKALGGSGVYASFAASFFTDVQMIGVVGGDWNPDYTALLRSRRIDLEGLEVRQNEKTCFWAGKYFDDMNRRETLSFEGNAMGGEYVPIVPESYRDAKFVFLGNGSPKTDAALLDALTARPKLIVADTMNYYIDGMRDELLALLKRVDVLIVNDSEAELLTGDRSAISAGKKILELGPKYALVKKGEHGAIFLGKNEIYLIPAFPTASVVDPTGAGDAFGGAFCGCLAETNGELSPENVKSAMLYATVVASVDVEGFGLERFQNMTRSEIDERVAQFKKALC